MASNNSSASSMPMSKRPKHHDRVFPKVLYRLLQAAATEGWEHVASWNLSGTSFKIHDRDQFLKILASRYGMKQTHYKSFVRQLSLWGFRCIHGGKKNAERGSYFHERFVCNEPSKMEHMRRVVKVGKTHRAPPAANNTKKQQAASMNNEDDTGKSNHAVVDCLTIGLDELTVSNNTAPPLAFVTTKQQELEDGAYANDLLHFHAVDQDDDAAFLDSLEDSDFKRELLDDLDEDTVEWLISGLSMSDPDYARLMGDL